MYRYLNILLSVLLALVLQSCGKGGGQVVEEYFEVSPEQVDFDSFGGQENIAIRSSEDWVMRSGESWVRTVVATGKASSVPVKAGIICDENKTGLDRETSVTVKTMSGKSKSVTVKQSATGSAGSHGISTADDLVAFAAAVNGGQSLNKFMVDGAVTLVNDIDVSSVKQWTPVGTAESPFTGTFDGKGFSIKNVNWNIEVDKTASAGFFGVTKNATVMNVSVGVKGDKITLAGTPAVLNAGVITGYAIGGTMSGCTANADIFCSAAGPDVCVAGLCGRSTVSTGDGLLSCINNGNVICSAACRAAGLVGWNEAKISACTNNGCILAESSSNQVGPAWGCSYNKTVGYFTGCKGRGHVGSYASWKDNPSGAPSDAYLNALASPARRGYTLTDEKSDVNVDWTRDSYYDWTVTRTQNVCSGVVYTQYSCTWVPRIINVLEIDLSNPNVDVSTSFANDCVPNPNGNKNSNNGFNIRETLSQLCVRKRAEGQNVVAGINTGFFDSNDGICRGFHVEDGFPVYVNNPSVVNGLPNHSWGLTVFADGTASCGKKAFSGKIKAGGKEFSYSTINDTTMRHTSSSYRINLYTSQYKQYPHPEKKSLVNALAPDALYVIAEFTGDRMVVNGGYADAKVVKVADGRTTALSSLPYITSDRQIGIALSGNDASQFAAVAPVGATVSLRCDISVDGVSKPIHTQNSTMFRIMQDGKDATGTIPAGHSVLTSPDPITFPVVSNAKKKLWLVEVDGRNDWVSLGVVAYELYRIGLKLGGDDASRFDGGGSSTMWVYDSAKGSGSVVNTVSDSKGERSCMNYIIIKSKQ